MNKLLRMAVHHVFMAPEGDGGGGTGAAALATAPATPATPPNGGAPGGTAPPAGGAAPAGGDTGAGAEWYKDFKDPNVKTWLTAYKGAYPDAEAVALKALNLEKFVGADKAERGIVVPKPDAPQPEWDAFYRKVGSVPEKAEGYALPKEMDKAEAERLSKDPMFAKFREHAHKIGLPPAFFGSVMGWFSQQAAEMGKGAEGALEADIERELGELKEEWKGATWDTNVEMARRAVTNFVPGKTPEERAGTMSKIEAALGTKETYKLFASIGKGMGEADFVQGDGRGGGTGMTPEGARLRIKELQQDKAWAASWASGDTDKKAEWERLHKIASGTVQ